jgi:hypothetical protein
VDFNDKPANHTGNFLKKIKMLSAELSRGYGEWIL